MKEYDIMPEKIKHMMHIIGGENGLDFAESVWEIVSPTANGYGWNDDVCTRRLESVIFLTRALAPLDEVLAALRRGNESEYERRAKENAKALYEKLCER